MSLVSVENLTIGFEADAGTIPVVEDISFDIGQGEIVGLVGESGCGKSVTAMSIMRLLPTPPSRVMGGRILFAGQDLLQLREKEMQVLRGNRLSMIFQEPMTSLNPTFTVGFQLIEALRLHEKVSRAEAEKQALDMLDLVGVSAPKRRLSQYPYELSGGLRQRIMIAMALMCRPGLLIADEPTTALDVTIQAQILDLLTHLRDEMNMGILMITHDLGVVAEFCDRVLVMYAGRVVETATVDGLFRQQRHPYSRGLLSSIPRLEGGKGRLPTIPGIVPSPETRSASCTFADRCSSAIDKCRVETPPLTGDEDHRFACWNPVS